MDVTKSDESEPEICITAMLVPGRDEFLTEELRRLH